jgi:TonB family protein
MRLIQTVVVTILVSGLTGCTSTQDGSSPPPQAAVGPAHFTGNYVDVSEVDKQPRIISRPAPVYPFQLRRAGISGSAQIAFLVDTEGRTTQVQAEAATNAEFALAAVAAVSNWRFTPAMKDGAAILCRLSVPLSFSISQYQSRPNEWDSPRQMKPELEH